jgi:hypothetical protein
LLFEPTVEFRNVSGLLTRAIHIGTHGAWKNRVRACEEQERGNPLIRDYLAERFGLELAMNEVRERRAKTGRMPDIHTTDIVSLRLYAFAAMLAGVYDRLSPQAQKYLEGRVRGGLRDDQGLASLEFELRIAADLMRSGIDVDWHDLENGGFDVTARHAGIEVAIECKTFSADVGRSIHKRRLYQLGGIIFPSLTAALENRGSIFVDVTIADRLAGAAVRDVGHIVGNVLRSSDDFLGPIPATVTLTSFATEGTPFDGRIPRQELGRGDILSFVQRRFGRDNANLLLHVNHKKDVGLVCVGSHRPDTVLRGIYRALSEAATQLPTDRPGVICAHLLDLSPEQLVDLSEAPLKSERPTGFHLMMGKYFSSDRRDHVYAVKFSTPGAIHRNAEISGNILHRYFGEGGPSFVLSNNAHPMAKDLRMAVFK